MTEVSRDEVVARRAAAAIRGSGWRHELKVALRNPALPVADWLDQRADNYWREQP